MRTIIIIVTFITLLFFPITISAEELSPIEFGNNSNLAEVMTQYYAQEDNKPTYGESYTSNQLISLANWFLKTLGAQDVTLLVFGKNPRADKTDTFLTGGVIGDPRDNLILGIFPEVVYDALSYMYSTFEKIMPIWLVFVLVIIGALLMVNSIDSESRTKMKDYLTAFIVALISLRFGYLVWIIVLKMNYFIIDIIWAMLQDYGVTTGLFLDMIWGTGINGYDSLLSVGNTLGIAFLVCCAAMMTFMMNYQYAMRLVMLSVLLISFPFAHTMSIFPKYRHAAAIWWEEFNLNIFIQSGHAIALGLFFLILAANSNLDAKIPIDTKAYFDISVDQRQLQGHLDQGKTLVWTNVSYKGEGSSIRNVPVSLYVDGRLHEIIYLDIIENGKSVIAEFRDFPATLEMGKITNKLEIKANDPVKYEEFNQTNNPFNNNKVSNLKVVGSLKYSLNFFIIFVYFFGFPTIIVFFRKLLGASDSGNSMMGGIGMMMGVTAMMNMGRMFRANNGQQALHQDTLAPVSNNLGAPLINPGGFGEKILGNSWAKGAAMTGGAVLGSALSTMATGKGSIGMIAGGLLGKVIGQTGKNVGSIIDESLLPSNQDNLAEQMQERYMSGQASTMTKAAVQMGWGAERFVRLVSGGRFGAASFDRDAYIADNKQLFQDSQLKMQDIHPRLKIAESNYNEMRAKYGQGSEWYERNADQRTGRVNPLAMPESYQQSEKEYKKLQSEYFNYETQHRQAQHKLTNYNEMKNHIQSLEKHQSSSSRGRI